MTRLNFSLSLLFKNYAAFDYLSNSCTSFDTSQTNQKIPLLIKEFKKKSKITFPQSVLIY